MKAILALAAVALAASAARPRRTDRFRDFGDDDFDFETTSPMRNDDAAFTDSRSATPRPTGTPSDPTADVSSTSPDNAEAVGTGDSDDKEISDGTVTGARTIDPCALRDTSTFCPRFIRACQRSCNPLQSPSMICYSTADTDPVYHCSCHSAFAKGSSTPAVEIDKTGEVLRRIEPGLAGCFKRTASCNVQFQRIFNSDGSTMISGTVTANAEPRESDATISSTDLTSGAGEGKKHEQVGKVVDWLVLVTTTQDVNVEYVVNGSVLGKTKEAIVVVGNEDDELGKKDHALKSVDANGGNGKVGDDRTTKFALILSEDVSADDLRVEHCHVKLSIAPRRGGYNGSQ